MTATLEQWNDGRMDDLADRVDEIGVQLREQHRDLRLEMQAQVRELRRETLELRRGIKAAAISISSSAIVGFAALLATRL